MAPTNNSVDKIIQGAIRSLGRQGLRKFSMSDICEESGVSRGTLYRYFKSRDQVLEAVAEYTVRSLRAYLDRAVIARPATDVRVEVVLQALFDYGKAYPETIRVLEVEPGFALGFLTREFPTLLGVVADSLEPALASAPPVRDGTMTKRQLAEIFLRLSMSCHLLPTAGVERTPQRVGAMWQSLIAHGTEAPSRRRQVRAAG